jgi:hypothetical protein
MAYVWRAMAVQPNICVAVQFVGRSQFPCVPFNRSLSSPRACKMLYRVATHVGAFTSNLQFIIRPGGV